MEDNEIIKLYWDRNECAISETADKYGKRIKSISINILNDTGDADECVNDTYLAAWNTMPDSWPKVLSAYLFRIVKNLSLKKYEYNSAKKRNSGMDIAFEELENMISEEYSTMDSPDHSLEAKELGVLITEFLESIDALKSTVFIRRYWYYDTIEEISESLSLSKGYVKVILYRTRKLLKKFLISNGVIL